MLRQAHADGFLSVQAASEHGHGEMLKLLATDGPMSSVTKPINDAVEWVTGTGKKEDADADGHADGHADGGDANAEEGKGLTGALSGVEQVWGPWSEVGTAEVRLKVHIVAKVRV